MTAPFKLNVGLPLGAFGSDPRQSGVTDPLGVTQLRKS